MVLTVQEAVSDEEARELIASGEVRVVLVGDVLAGASEESDQSFCRVFASSDMLAAIRQRMNWDHPPDPALGDDFVVAWGMDAADAGNALQREFRGE